MSTRSLRSHLGLLLGALALSSCSTDEPAANAAEPYVLASFYPLTYFAQRIAGDQVAIDCPLPADADPEFWRPSRPDIAACQGATLILINGASFEKWVDKVSLPKSRVVDTSAAFAARFLTFATVTHSHGAGGEHTHAGVDGHTWLDPINAKQQSQAIHDALAKAFAKHTATFATGLAALHQDLDALDARFAAVTKQLGDRKLLASHPAYNYLAARYGWKISNLDLDPDAEWNDAAMTSVSDAMQGASGCILLWEDAPKASAVTALTARGVRSVVFSPVESHDQSVSGDYLTRMRDNVERLAAACK